MEYQVKKKQILEEVQYTNLLTFTLAQNRLEKNFRSLVEALMLNQDDTRSLKDQFGQFKAKNSHDLKYLTDKIAQIEGKLNDRSEGQKNSNNSRKQTSIHKEASSEKIKDQEEKQKSLEEKEESNEQFSQPQLNFNLVQSEKDLDDLQGKDDLNQRLSQYEKMNEQRYNEIKNILNILRHDQMQNSNINKDLSTLRDNINSIKGELKTINDRSQKSIKRVSLNAIENTQTARQNTSNHSIEKPTLKVQEELEKQMNSIYIQLNTLKLCLEQTKEQVADSRRKEGKLSLMIEELQKGLKKLNDKQNDDVERIEKELKELKMQQLIGGTDTKKDSQSRKVIQNTSSNNNNGKQNSGNSLALSREIGQVNDKLNKIQGALTNFITSTELNRLKSNLQQKITALEHQDENLHKEIKDQVQILMQINDEKNEKIRNIQKQMKDHEEQIKENASHFERKNNITLSKIEELRKNLQNLREDLQFYKSMNDDNNKNQPTISNNTQPTTEEKDLGDKKGKIDSVGVEELKKYFNRKLHDQRGYLLGLIRDLQKKSSNKTGFENDIVGLWDKIGEFNLFLNKKANDDDVKKHLAFMDKKISAIYNRITSTQENNDDARVAKTSWFCLSCDKNLQNYQGKIGKHIIWDSMPMKSNFTRYKQDDKKSLPTLKR